MYPYVENPRHERFHGIFKIPNAFRKKLLRDFARHRTQHNGKVKSPKNGDHPYLNAKCGQEDYMTVGK